MNETSGPKARPPAAKRMLSAGLNTAGAGGAGLALLAFGGALDWRIDLLAHLRVHALLALLALGFACLALRQWIAVFGCAGGVAIHALALGLSVWGGPPAVAPGGLQVRVFNHNVFTANRRFADVAEQIRSFDPDVLVLEELDEAWVAALDGELGKLRPRLVVPAAAGNFGIGVWVREGSLVGLDGGEILELGGAGVPALRLRLRVGEHPLELLAVHTLPPNSEDLARRHAAQMLELGELARASQGAWVAIGDFNSTPCSARYRSLVARGGLASAGGLSGTWPAKLPGVLRIPIDHCFVRGPLGVLDQRLGEARGSDHLPLLLELAFPGPLR